MRTDIRASRHDGEDTYYDLFERVPVGLYRSTPAGEIVDVNPALVRMLGYSDRGTLLAETAGQLYAHPESRERWLSELEAKGTVSGFETAWRRRDGSVIWVEEDSHAVRSEDGTVLHYEGSAKDVTRRREIESRLTEEKARFEQLFAAAPEAIVLCANDATVLRVNEEFTRLFGYSEDEAIGQDIDDLVAKGLNGLHEHATHVTSSIAGGETTLAETRRRRKNGDLIDVSILGRSIVVDGEQIALYAIYRDISARVEAENALAAARVKVERLHEAADALGSAESEDEVYRVTVDAAERVLGFSFGILCIIEEGSFVCRAASSSVEPERLPRAPIEPVGIAIESLDSGQPVIVNDPNPSSLPNGMPPTSRSLVCAPIGKIGIFQAASTEVGTFDEEDGRLLAILLGHTAVAVERLRLQDELVRQARHDALTGVYNRHYFNELIAQEVLRAFRYDHPIGLLMIDVDRFKEINDRYGHQTGDMVLKEIASVLRATVRATDMIVRYGGDEFLVVLTETGEDAEEAAIRIRAAVRSNETLREISRFDVTVSVGSIFWHPETERSIEEALAEADARMYDDKRNRSE